MLPRMMRIWQSFRSIPLWVQVWISVFLFPVNAASLALTHWDTGFWAACAFAVVGISNIAMLLIQSGLSRLMALPHVVAWLPLQAYLLQRLVGHGHEDLGSSESTYTMILFSINAVSLGFDLLDSWKWLRGARDVRRPPSH
ncbi:MAG: hypothetical protein U5M53_07610 [Rhodoferax sp.]|nr:hypothetical protein [Rhodoferax sp.]